MLNTFKFGEQVKVAWRLAYFNPCGEFEHPAMMVEMQLSLLQIPDAEVFDQLENSAGMLGSVRNAAQTVRLTKIRGTGKLVMVKK